MDKAKNKCKKSLGRMDLVVPLFGLDSLTTSIDRLLETLQFFLYRFHRVKTNSPLSRRENILLPARLGKSVFLAMLLRNDLSCVCLNLVLRHPTKRVSTSSCSLQYFILPTFPASNQVPEITSTLPPTKFLAPRRGAYRSPVPRLMAAIHRCCQVDQRPLLQLSTTGHARECMLAGQAT